MSDDEWHPNKRSKAHKSGKTRIQAHFSSLGPPAAGQQRPAPTFTATVRPLGPARSKRPASTAHASISHSRQAGASTSTSAKRAAHRQSGPSQGGAERRGAVVFIPINPSDAADTDMAAGYADGQEEPQPQQQPQQEPLQRDQQLFKENAKVYVLGDPDREPAWLQELRQQMQTLMGKVHNLETGFKDLETALQRQRNLALRELLAMSREKLAGHKLSSEEKTTWNSQLSNIVAPPGVTQAAIRLTRYGAGTDLEDGNTAARVFADAMIADAVVSLPIRQAALYRQLFMLCFNKTADDVILSLELPDEDEEGP